MAPSKTIKLLSSSLSGLSLSSSSTNKTRKIMKSSAPSALSKASLFRKKVSLNPIQEIGETIFKMSPEDSKFKVEDHLFDNYYKIKFLGQGAFGKVYQSHKKGSPTGATYAAKVIHYMIPGKRTTPTGTVVDVSRDTSKLIQNEVNILRKLETHCKDYILCLKDSYIDHSAKNFYIVMEDLSAYRPIKSYIKDNYFSNMMFGVEDTRQPIAVDFKHENIKTIAHIFSKLIKGLALIHSKHIAHRDIKPDNILFNKDTGNIKFIDFGISCDLDNKIMQCFAYVGTYNYNDPLLREMQRIVHEKKEVLKEDIEKGDTIYPMKNLFKFDYWSLGITMFEMLSGYKPPDYLHRTIKTSEERKSIFAGFGTHEDFYMEYPGFMTNKVLRDKIYGLSGDYLAHWNRIGNAFKSIVEVAKKEKDCAYIVIEDLLNTNLKKRKMYGV